MELTPTMNQPKLLTVCSIVTPMDVSCYVFRHFQHCFRMESARALIKHQQKELNAIPAMTLNFDQLWQQLAAPKKRAIGHGIAVGSLVRGAKKEKRKQRAHQPTADIRLDTITGYRRAITTVTSTWGNGERGPIAFCVKPGFVAEAYIKQFNTQHKGRSYILVSETESHMMNAEAATQVIGRTDHLG